MVTTPGASHLIAQAKLESLSMYEDQSWEHGAAILAERAVTFARCVSPGYVRAAPPPVEPNVLREARE